MYDLGTRHFEQALSNKAAESWSNGLISVVISTPRENGTVRAEQHCSVLWPNSRVVASLAWDIMALLCKSFESKNVSMKLPLHDC